MMVSDYLHKPLDRLQREEIIAEAVTCLKPLAKGFDSIAFCGMSGALIAPVVADRLGKNLLMVRKGTEHSHTTMVVEGAMSRTRYIIIDDVVYSGATIRYIQDTLKDVAPAYSPEDGTYTPIVATAQPLLVYQYQGWIMNHILYPKGGTKPCKSATESGLF